MGTIKSAKFPTGDVIIEAYMKDKDGKKVLMQFDDYNLNNDASNIRMYKPNKVATFLLYYILSYIFCSFLQHHIITDSEMGS